LHKTKIYGFLKGMIDGGVQINCKEEAFPDLERIQGKHLKKEIPFDKIKSEAEKI
jgi:hypothetical protein